MNLTKKAEDLYTEKYKTLLKEIKEDTNKWKDILHSWIGKLKIFKMLILPKVIYRFNAILIKISQWCFFAEIEKFILKFIWNLRGLWIGQTILNKVGILILSNFKTYYKATIIKTVWSRHKDRHIDHWNRLEGPELNPHIYGQMIFNTGVKNIQWGKEFFQQMLTKLDIHM